MRSLVSIGLASLLLGCPSANRPASQSSITDPDILLERAIEQAGGAVALEGARALIWDADAVVEAGGRTVNIAGTWSVQPPDTAIVATYDTTHGPGSTRALIVAAPRGWIASNGRVEPMPATMLQNERDEFRLYDVMRLVSLRGRGVRRFAIEPDNRGQRGFRVEEAGRADVELYVDWAGRLSHIRSSVRDASTGAPVRQDIWLSGTIEAAGVRWPRRIRITLDDAPYFTMTLRSLRITERIDDPRLNGPPAQAPPGMPPTSRGR